MPETKRAYQSKRREIQARDTRRAIRTAASALFLRDGYVATSIAAIAERAGVAPETVYATFGSKRDLLFECVDVAIVGDDAPVALLDRPWARELLDERDARKRLRAIVDHGGEATARAAAFDSVLRSAAASDAKIAARLVEMDRGRYGDVRWMVERVAERGALRYDIEDATDLVYAVGGASVFNNLVGARGWTTERYLNAIYDIAARTLFVDVEPDEGDA